MRSKKDKDTVVVIITSSQEQVRRILGDNADNWEEIKRPELDDVLTEIDSMAPRNRAERRGGIRCSVDRGFCDREIKACCSCPRNK